MILKSTTFVFHCKECLVHSTVLILFMTATTAQEPLISLRQGRIVGVKVYPESSAYPVNMFLGIPFAQPPIGRLRFSAPARHRGWNKTLHAHRAAPRCPQPTSVNPPKIYDQSEDCLYLNIWTPQGAGEMGSERLPVILFLHGETWTSDAPCDIPGQDLAAEGIIFVSANYRLNVFGFFTLASAEARGNMGLLDQYLALVWIRENIEKFGGNPAAVTLAGHSAGATSILYHLASPRTSGLIHRAIIMSPIELWNAVEDINYPDWLAPATFTRYFLDYLGCDGSDPELVRCAQQLKMEDILRTYQILNSNGNWTDKLRPTSDSFLPEDARYIPDSLARSLDLDSSPRSIPTLFGINNLEDVNNNEELWLELASEGVKGVEQYVSLTSIPNLLRRHGLYSSANRAELIEAIRWEFFGETDSKDPWVWTEAAARLESSGKSAAAAAVLAKRLSRHVVPLYMYKYVQPGGVDLRGAELNHTGAAKGTELPLLLGPTLFQQLVRRRMLPAEETSSRILRILVSNFIKTGTPPDNRIGEGWHPYGSSGKAQTLSAAKQSPASTREEEFWLNYLPRLANITFTTDPREFLSQLRNSQASSTGAVWALGVLAAALAALLGAAGLMLRRATQHSDS